jgi:pyruvoyl-dependent arginine decarboxylase (PvlArgDC)
LLEVPRGHVSFKEGEIFQFIFSRLSSSNQLLLIFMETSIGIMSCREESLHGYLETILRCKI